MVELKCSSCGAKLEVNSDLDRYTCNYCGVTSVIDDESILVKNVSSKLQNELMDVKEYYDNGNYRKTYVLSCKLLEEYPKNKEVKKYYDLSLAELTKEAEEKKKRLEEEKLRMEKKNQEESNSKNKRFSIVGIGITIIGWILLIVATYLSSFSYIDKNAIDILVVSSLIITATGIGTIVIMLVINNKTY